MVFLSLSLSLKKKSIGGTLSNVFDLGGSPRQEKPAKSPRKGGGGWVRYFVSPEIGGAIKGREQAYAYPVA